MNNHTSAAASDPVAPRRTTLAGKADAKGNAFIYTILWLAVLAPRPSAIAGGPFNIDRVLDLILLTIVLYFFVSSAVLNARVTFPRVIQLPVFVYAALALLLPVAYWYSVALRNEPTGLRDGFELLRFPIVIVILIFLVQVDLKRANLTAFIEKAYIIPFWIVAGLCIVDVTKMPVLYDLKAAIWVQPKNTVAFAGRYVRLCGTLLNPNWFSLYLNMILGLFLFFRKRSLSTIIGIAVCIALIGLTGSLTGLAGLLFMAAACLLATGLGVIRRPMRGTLRLLVAIALVFTGFYTIRTIDNARIAKAIRNVKSGSDLLSVRSAELRAAQAERLIGQYLEDPRPLGFGPSKYFVADVIDNQYVEYLMRYGLVGFSLLMVFYLYSCRAAVSLRARSRDPVVRDYALFAALLTPLLLLYFITGQFADNLRLAILYFGLLAPVFTLLSPDSDASQAFVRPPPDPMPTEHNAPLPT